MARSSSSSTSLSSFYPNSSSSVSTPSTSPLSSPTSLKKLPSFPHLCQLTSQPSPPETQPNRPITLDARPHGIGVDPTTLIGRQLTCVRRSPTHPCTTLHFSDGSTFQVRVDGYDPHFCGVPKVLESDSPVLNPGAPCAPLRLTVSHAAAITLSDKAFQLRARSSSDAKDLQLGELADEREREDRWTQRHAAFALKFVEEPGWHCVWATMAEYDGRDGAGARCVFRNYADVYLDRLRPAAGVSALSPSSSPPISISIPMPKFTSPHVPASAPAHAAAFSAQAPAQKGQTGEKTKTTRKWGKNKSKPKPKPRADGTPTPKTRW